MQKLINSSEFQDIASNIHGDALSASSGPPIVIFGISLLQQWYRLPDPTAEDARSDRLRRPAQRYDQRRPCAEDDAGQRHGDALRTRARRQPLCPGQKAMRGRSGLIGHSASHRPSHPHSVVSQMGCGPVLSPSFPASVCSPSCPPDTAPPRPKAFFFLRCNIVLAALQHGLCRSGVWHAR